MNSNLLLNGCSCIIATQNLHTLNFYTLPTEEVSLPLILDKIINHKGLTIKIILYFINDLYFLYYLFNPHCKPLWKIIKATEFKYCRSHI